LDLAKERQVKNITLVGDSFLIIQSVYRQIPPSNIIIGRITQRILDLKESLNSLQVLHVLRDQNSKVDTQANQACTLDEGKLSCGEIIRWDLIP
jgi:hypothetical protein